MKKKSQRALVVEIPISPLYENSYVAIGPMSTQLIIPLQDGGGTITTAAVQVGNLSLPTSVPLMATFSLSYGYDSSIDAITVCSDDLVAEDSPYLTTFPLGTVDYCNQHSYSNDTTACGSNQTWNYCSSSSYPGLAAALQGTVKQINAAIIQSAESQGLNVIVRSPMPNISPDLYRRLGAVYRDGKFIELYDEAKTYDEGFLIRSLDSMWFGEIYLTPNEQFANVIGSTRDPKIAGLAWIQLWINQFGAYGDCTSLNVAGVPGGGVGPFACTPSGILYGGHVILGQNAQVIPAGSNIVFIIPICPAHNNNDNIYMEARSCTKGIAIHNYLNDFPAPPEHDKTPVCPLSLTHMKTKEFHPATSVNILPGASSLGYGFNVVTATSPTALKYQIIDLDEMHGSTITRFGIEYLLPGNVSEIDRNINSLVYNTFTSESQYCQYMSAQFSGSGSSWGFSAEFASSYSNLSQGDNTNFYGLVQASSILWDAQLKSVAGVSLNPNFITALNNLPTTFGMNNQALFFEFFDTWGTHIVNQCQVGGSLNYLVTSENSSGLTQSAAAASMQLEYESLFVSAEAKAAAEWSQMASSWISSRKAQLTAVGGSPSVLNGLTGPTNPTWSPDYSCATLVSNWTTTLPQNPSVTNFNLTPISDVVATLGIRYKTGANFQNQSNQLAIALAVYLNAPILVSNTSSFTASSVGAMPFLSGSSTTIAIDENTVSPPNPPRITDLSMYWIVMADANGSVIFNENSNTEDPDEFDTLIQEAQNASQGQKLWVCVSIVNQTQAPLSVSAINWLKQIGVDTTSLQPDGFYPGMCCVVSVIGKTNCDFQNGQINHYQPCQTYFGYGGLTQDITVEVARPAYADIDG